MSKIAYKSNRNVYYSCKYHVVFCPKYRRKVLIEGIAERFKQIIAEVCQEHQAEVFTLEVMPDHVHLVVECDPQFGIHRLVRLMKARSSRFLRQEFPVLKRKLPTLWTNSYFVSTAGEHRSPSSSTISRTKNMSNLKAYKYRLYPNKHQTEKLQWTLERARELYNAALQERRDAYRMCRVSISYNQQAAQLPEVKGIRPEYNDIHSQVLQDVLRRVKKAYDHFFRRVKAGKTPGYPVRRIVGSY